MSPAALDRTLTFLLPALLIGGLLGLWQLSDALFGIPAYMLPKPSDFIGQFWTNYPLLSMLLSGFWRAPRRSIG